MFACKLAGWLILLLALYFPYWYGRKEGYSDAKKIRRNGSKDDLKEKWHSDNAKRRGVALTTGILISYGLLFATLKFDLWFMVAYGFYAVVCFGTLFTTTLNCKRLLPRWYVSHDPRASETDKFMIRGSAALGMQPQAFNRLVHVGFLALAFLLLVLAIVYNLL